MAQDFQACAMGILHYSTLPSSHLRACTEKVHKYLGFRTVVAQPDDSVKGALISTTCADFRAGWEKLQCRILRALSDLESANTADTLVDAFNDLAANRLVTLITLAAHRGSKISRLTWRALYTHQQLIYVYDKDVGKYQSDRVVPAHALVDQLLACWQEDLKLFLRRSSELGLSIRKEGRRAIEVTSTDQPAFFQTQWRHENHAICIVRKPIRHETLANTAHHCFGRPLNVGRHFIVSQLVISGVDTWLIRVLTGHSRIHAEPFSDAMGVPPKLALERLGAAVDKLFTSMDLAPIGRVGSCPATRALVVPSGRVPAIGTDQYLHPRISAESRVLPPPFDVHSLLAVRVVDEFRSEMLSKPRMEVGPMLVASLTLFDVMDPADQQITFEDLNRSIVLIGSTTWITWKRQGCSQEIFLPLNPRSVMVLTKLDRTLPGKWSEHAAAVGDWAKNKFPKLKWPSDKLEAYETLAALALRWRRYQCSPNALTAQCSAIPAATPSRRSLLRIAADPQLIPVSLELGKAVRQGSNKQRFRTTGILHAVAKTLRDAGKTTDRSGEELKRARNIMEELFNLDASIDTRAVNLKDVILQEARLTISKSPSKDEFSSLAGYLDEVLPALGILSPWDDLSAFTGEETQEWVEVAKRTIDEQKKDTVAVRRDQPRHFGLKRFLRTGASLGWEVPKRLFLEGGDHALFDGMRKSAASTVVLDRDHFNIRRLLQNYFEDWPVISQRAVLAQDLLRHALLRSMEQIVLRKNCIVSSMDALSIQPDSFSHLKSKHAPRLIQLPEELCARIFSIVDDPTEPENRYLFLSDDAKDWSLAEEIDEALVSAATQVTGEASIRKHSFRAAAVAKRVWPEWEAVATALFEGNWTPAQYREFVERQYFYGFPHFILGTREAGHGHPLITLVYYCSPWTFILAAQLLATLDGVEPSGALIADSLNGTDVIRTARSRAIKAGKHFDVWGHAAKLAVKKVNPPQLVALDTPAIIIPRAVACEADKLEIIACVRFAASVLLGQTVQQSAQRHGLPFPQAHRLAALLPNGEERETLIKRRRGQASEDSLAGDRFFLTGELSPPLISTLLAAPASDLKQLGDDLSHERPAAKKPAMKPSKLLDRMQRHLACLPSTAGLQIRFSSNRPCPVTPEMLRPLGERLVVGNNNDRIGAYPMFQVVEMRGVDNARASGRWTAVARILVAAVLTVDSFLKGSLQ